MNYNKFDIIKNLCLHELKIYKLLITLLYSLTYSIRKNKLKNVNN